MSESTPESVELQVRQILAQEAGRHREFLESQLRLVLRSFTVVLALLLGGAYYLFGNSIASTEERLLREIDRKVIEYRINDALRVQLEKEVRVVLGGDEAVELVALRVRNQVEEEVRTAAGTLIADSVSRAIDEAQGINLNDAIREVVSNEVQPLFNQLRVEIQKVRQQLVTMDRDPKRLAVPGSPVLVQ